VNGGACTNPEELIAAAHASSFTICLAQMLAEANLAVDHINTTALLTLDSSHRGFAISHLHLVLTASATFADEKTFLSLVARAKEDCAVSRLLNAQISVDAKLIDRTALQEWNRRIQ
jgi:lipoyl-dependent peroxiredoxin